MIYTVYVLCYMSQDQIIAEQCSKLTRVSYQCSDTTNYRMQNLITSSIFMHLQHERVVVVESHILVKGLL